MSRPRNPYRSKWRTFCRRMERELVRERMLAVPHALFVIGVLASLTVERPRHPDSKRQRTRRERDLAFDRCRALKAVQP